MNNKIFFNGSLEICEAIIKSTGKVMMKFSHKWVL